MKPMGRYRPINFLGAFPLAETADPWREILREAIGEGATEPLRGTHFRSALDASAAKHGLRFPPESEPNLKFIQLIQRYSDVVSIMRRPGQDFLVVPAGRSDLLTKGVQGRIFGIRKDLFDAFTIVSNDRRFYDKAADKIFWRRLDTTDEPSHTGVPIEPPTTASEIELRREFVASLSEESTRLALSDALAQPLPFSAFGKSVRGVGVQRAWHRFRTEQLSERIQRWAKDNGIEWKDAWLTEGSSERWKDAALAPSTERVEADALHVLFSGLDAADIQRISIPLDLVLKVISASRKTT